MQTINDEHALMHYLLRTLHRGQEYAIMRGEGLATMRRYDIVKVEQNRETVQTVHPERWNNARSVRLWGLQTQEVGQV